MASCVDFVPAMLQKQAFTTPAVYESFSVLVGRANEWVAAHPNYDVITCESVETYMEPRQTFIISDKSGFLEQNHVIQMLSDLSKFHKNMGSNMYRGIRSYRHWPFKCSTQMCGKYPKYETFQQTIAQANATFQTHPLSGKILKVETIQLKFPKLAENIDADVTHWMMYRPNIYTHLDAVRIFYKQGSPQKEQIGVMDFIPQQVGEQTLLNKTAPAYESFSELMGETCEWIKSASAKVINIQSLHCKFEKQVSTIDTDCTTFHDEMCWNYYHVRFIRVAFIVGGSTQNKAHTFRTFAPVQLGKHGAASFGQHEGIAQTMSRVQAWIGITGARETGVETVLTDVSAPNQQAHSERALDVKQAKGRSWYTWYLRFYFDGPFNEPAPVQLTPVPEADYSAPSSSCNIL